MMGDRRLEVVDKAARLARSGVIEPDELRRVLAAGALAPSVHNTQPWRFVLTSSGIEVHADGGRALNRQDPDHRELVISCGAAVMNMRVAAAAIGRRLVVDVLPDTATPSHLATLRFGAYQPAPLDEAKLYEAVARRHTYRRSFRTPRPDTPHDALIAELRAVAAAEGAEMAAVAEPQRRGVLHLVRSANRTLGQDVDYLRELRTWTRTQDWASDGVSVTAFGSMPQIDDPPLRDFGLGHPWIGRSLERFLPEEWVVFATDADDVESWLRAGQAIERALLVMTLHGWAASFLTQPIEVASVREELRHHLELTGYPQVVLRIGTATPPPTAGRRPLEEVVTLGEGAAQLLVGDGGDGLLG